MNVIVLKLISGEEVIAELDSQDEVAMIVNKPRVMQIIRGHDGSISGGLVPYLISDPDRKGVTLYKSAIACSFPANLELSNSYMSATSSLILG